MIVEGTLLITPNAVMFEQELPNDATSTQEEPECSPATKEEQKKPQTQSQPEELILPMTLISAVTLISSIEAPPNVVNNDSSNVVNNSDPTGFTAQGQRISSNPSSPTVFSSTSDSQSPKQGSPGVVDQGGQPQQPKSLASFFRGGKDSEKGKADQKLHFKNWKNLENYKRFSKLILNSH